MCSEVVKFFNGSNVFITGGTGFLGSALLEKLLREFHLIGTIYLLLRSKRDKDPNDRIEDLKNDRVFERLLQEQPDIFKKVVAIPGDVGTPGLGLSAENREILIQNVHIVFHCAATLDFEASLRTTVTINLLGTREVVSLSKEITNLKALLHVSSAYANSDKVKVKEIIYPLKEDPDKVINLVATLKDVDLDEITPKILGKHPNTYTFTKFMAEHEVKRAEEVIPTAIVRPSMITAAWYEPVPGWTSSKNGPTGFIMGAAKGVVRRLPANKELIYDYIPVDVVVNSMIVATFKTGMSRRGMTHIFHCTSSTTNPFRWKTVEKKINKYLHIYPLASAVWYPHLKLLPSLLLFRVSAIFIHFIPAFILDLITKICGGRPILVRLHTNVWRSLSRLEPFIFNEWFFDSACAKAVYEDLDDYDKKHFYMDISKLNWESYFVEMIQGVREFLNKERPTNLSKALFKDKMLLVLNILVQSFVMGLVWFGFSRSLDLSLYSSLWMLPLLYGIFSIL